MRIQRRSALSSALLAALTTRPYTTLLPVHTHPALAATAPTDPNRARAQLANAETALVDLIRDFDALAQKEGGDGIRRVLGTVGTASPLYRIENAAKTLAEDATDPEAFYGGLERLMLDLQRADSGEMRLRRAETRAPRATEASPRVFDSTLTRRCLPFSVRRRLLEQLCDILVGQGHARGLLAS